MIHLISFVLCLLTLSYACISDIRSRTVSNKLWGVFFVATLPLVIYNIIIGTTTLFQTAIAVILIYAVVNLLFHLRAFDGADAKAFIALAFLYSSISIPAVVLFLSSLFALIAAAIHYISHSSVSLSDMRHIRIPFFVSMFAAYPISAIMCNYL